MKKTPDLDIAKAARVLDVDAGQLERFLESASVNQPSLRPALTKLMNNPKIERLAGIIKRLRRYDEK